jgi:predicted Holliday junction resolvase-like endonuclease
LSLYGFIILFVVVVVVVVVVVDLLKKERQELEKKLKEREDELLPMYQQVTKPLIKTELLSNALVHSKLCKI